MKIEYVFGSLLASNESVIAHGCNAQGVMKSGIAKDIRERYPVVYWDYQRDYQQNNKQLFLGDVISTEYLHPCYRVILSLITQEFYGREEGKRYVSYDAITRAIERINKIGYSRVAFPMIGAGLANGNWTVIESIIESYSDFTPVVYYIDERLKERFGG